MFEGLLKGRRFTFVFGAAALVAIAVGATVTGQSPPPRKTWSDYGGGPDSAKYSTLTEITKDNVRRLQPVWSYPTYDNLAYRFGPLVVDNVAYVLARNNSLVALDATTGKEIWIHGELQGIAPRGINYWESKDRSDRRLIFQRNGYLEEIDAKTGKSILTFGTDGAVNLREGLGRDPKAIGQIQSPNPGKVFENLIILGSAPGEAYLSPPGDLRAFDVITGKLAWQFHNPPHPGEFGYETWPKDAWKYIGGTNTWGEISVDPVRGIAYFPIGSPTYDYYGADRHGSNLFGTSLVALDARTGKRLWHFQMVHHDLWDYDNTAAPQLTTIRHNGQLVDVVAQAGKTGFLYVFNRVTGEPIWPIEERPVPKSDVLGEESWPTQPFPTNPPPFAKQSLNENEINPYILTPEERENWKTRIAAARKGQLFIPPAVGIDTVAIPGAQGGANWGTTAADPTNGTVYVLSINVPSIYRLADQPPGANRAGGAGPQGRGADPAVVAQGHTIYDRQCQSCHAANLTGVGNYPSLVDVTTRLSAEELRTIITGGRLAMPPNPMPAADMDALIAFLANPGAPGAGGGGGFGRRGAGPEVTGPPGPVVARGGAPGSIPPARGSGGGMAGPPYPPDVEAPGIRYYTDYGMQSTLVKPPYSTLTAYDLNTGTIKWQVPAGGDDPRAVAEGATDTGFPLARTGIISTATGLLFQAGGDKKIRAYDSATGKVLWIGDLPAGSTGIPAMYEVNGKQYLLVSATQGGGRGAGGGGAGAAEPARGRGRGRAAGAPAAGAAPGAADAAAAREGGAAPQARQGGAAQAGQAEAAPAGQAQAAAAEAAGADVARAYVAFALK